MATLHLANEIFNLIYPVGSIYISTTSANPSTYFGGIWEAIAGRFLIGVGKNTDDNKETWSFAAGQAKGAYNHTLNVSQIPNHSHGQYVTANAGTGGPANRTDFDGDGAGYSCYPQGCNTMGTGGGQPHNNMPPYLVVYMWKRTK